MLISHDTPCTLCLQLRRERSGLEDGRTYTITINAEDASGNKSDCSVVVGVPHDQRGKKGKK